MVEFPFRILESNTPFWIAPELTVLGRIELEPHEGWYNCYTITSSRAASSRLVNPGLSNGSATLVAARQFRADARCSKSPMIPSI